MAKYIILENECFLVKDVDGKDYPGCFIPTLFPRMGTGHDIFRALESQRVQMYTLLWMENLYHKTGKNHMSTKKVRNWK